MSASGSVGDEVETSFVSTESSRSRSYHPSSLYVQNESVAHSKSSPSGEEAPLLSSRGTSLSSRSKIKPLVISLLILTCVLAACVTFTSISLLVVYPETLQSNVQQILPNNTILAVPEGGLNPTIINYVTYRYYYGEESSNERDTLFLYHEQCSNLKSLIKAHTVDLNYSLTLPVDSLDFTTIDNQYLLNGSSLTYHINLTLSPPAAYYCYGIAQARGEEVIKIVEICNTTAAEFTVSSELESYFQVIVSLLNSENDLKIQAISVRANGTVFYYDISSLHDRFVCQLHPRVQTSCTIPINSVSEAGYHKNNLCILARREGSIDEKDDPMSPFFEYNIASFSYGQVILVIFICVGLVSFVCMLGLSVSCCTKQGRRLRVILHMSSPLVN